MKKAEEDTAMAHITIELPKNAKLYVQGQQMDIDSTKQEFVTPALERNTRYSYTMKVEADLDGEMISETKKVGVQAGQALNVNFREMIVNARKKRAELQAARR